jgi:hypothetical protein
MTVNIPGKVTTHQLQHRDTRRWTGDHTAKPEYAGRLPNGRRNDHQLISVGRARCATRPHGAGVDALPDVRVATRPVAGARLSGRATQFADSVAEAAPECLVKGGFGLWMQL